MTQDTQTQIAAIERALQARRGEYEASAQGEWVYMADPYQPSDYNESRHCVLAKQGLVAYTNPVSNGKADAALIVSLHNREAASIDYAEATLAKWAALVLTDDHYAEWNDNRYADGWAACKLHDIAVEEIARLFAEVQTWQCGEGKSHG